MKVEGAGGRANQKLRTRTALVTAAIALLRSGKTPTISEVAEAALVSPATAYRYFPNSQTLWLAVLAAKGEPDKAAAFDGLEHAGVEERVDAMIRSAAFRMLDDENLWRTVSRARFAQPPVQDRAQARIPVNTGQRMRWIREALAPFEKTLGRSLHRRLTMALALVIGSETMITLRDICGLPVEEAKDVSLWVGQALVRAALAEQRRHDRPRRAPRRPRGANARDH